MQHCNHFAAMHYSTACNVAFNCVQRCTELRTTLQRIERKGCFWGFRHKKNGAHGGAYRNCSVSRRRIFTPIRSSRNGWKPYCPKQYINDRTWWCRQEELKRGSGRVESWFSFRRSLDAFEVHPTITALTTVSTRNPDKHSDFTVFSARMNLPEVQPKGSRLRGEFEDMVFTVNICVWGFLLVGDGRKCYTRLLWIGGMNESGKS